MRVVEHVTDLIGGTPMIRLGALHESGEADIFAKLDYLNPGMSVKDRTALGLIRAAERDGRLKRGGTIIEATAGNTGVGLALVGANRGYHVVIVMIGGYAVEKTTLIRGLGGKVVTVPAEAGMAGAVEKARQLAEAIPGAVMMEQFDNPANAGIHFETTGPEIWEQMEGRVDGVALGAGTGGTFTGVCGYLRKQNSDLQCMVVEPPDSILGGGDGHGEHLVEGIGNQWWPKILDQRLVDGVYTIPHPETFQWVDRIARIGLCVGPSSGANLAGAKRLARRLGPGRRVVTMFTDPAERYFSKYQYDGCFEGHPIEPTARRRSFETPPERPSPIV